MVKNLKLNIKNAQLAEALKLTRLKKTPTKKKKETQAEAKEAPAPATPVEKALDMTFDSSHPPITVTEKQPSSTKETPPPEQAKKEKTEPSAVQEINREVAQAPTQTPPKPESTAPAARPFQSSYERRPYQNYSSSEGGDTYNRGERRPYTPRESGERRPYTPGQGSGERRPYTPRESGERRPYTPGQGPGERRPYTPRESGERRPYTPGQGSGERRPYTPRESGERRSYTPGGGAPGQGSAERRPYIPREKRPYPPRAENTTYKKPYIPRGAQEFKKPFPSKEGEFKKASTQKDAFSPKKGIKTPSREEATEESKKGIAHRDFRDYKAQRKQIHTERAFDSRDRQGLRADLDDQMWRKKRAFKTRPVIQEEVIRPKNLKVRLPISVKDLAAEMKLKASQLITNLFMKGLVLTLNDFLDDATTVQLLGHDFDCEITIDTSEEERVRITDKTIKQEIQESPSEALITRSPVVAFMGHVDHGKTSLIDSIRKSNLTSGEAGAITQHIGAFKCQTSKGNITILDTPGHEAFSAMRMRGADVTDIVVLVIAGDEGMRTQTIEALDQAKNAGVAIMVAINKSDKPNFNAETVYRQLADQQLLPEAWGGQTITVNCSALTGDGMQTLVEMLALQAEVLELKANPHMRARGTVIESELHKGLGPVATLLVQNGTLRLGDCIVFSQNYARVKTMHDELDRELTQAGPSTPVKITGLSGLPEAGSEFIAVKDEKEAKELAEKRMEGKRFQMMQQPKRATTESFLQNTSHAVIKKTLNLILRADVQGSVEALKNSLNKIPSDKVELNIISSGVGEISESDVQLAQTSKATIIGFHTQIESHAASLIKELKVTVKLHDVIYHAVDDVKVIMTNLLDKIAEEVDLGTALVKAIFKASQLGVIAGCMVTDGIIKRTSHIRLLRDDQVVWKGPIASLKKVKEDAREVSKGHECGILLQNFNEVKVGDILQAFEINYLKQEL